MKDKEPTIQDVLEAVSDLSTHMDTKVTKIEVEIKEMKGEIKEMKGEIKEMKGEIRGSKSVMVTKDYLDQKFRDHKTEQPTVAEAADRKVTRLTKKLQYKQVLSPEEAFDIIG